MKKFFFVLWFLCCINKLFAIEALLGVSAYTLSKYRWEVELMNMGGYEVIVPYDVENAYLTFSGSQVRGIVGCNNFFANYQIQGGGKILLVSPGGVTRKMCASSAESQIEAIFTRIFEGRFAVVGNDEMVELIREDGFRIRLIPSVTIEP